MDGEQKLKHGNKICPGNRRGKRNFTPVERMEFLKILELNDYNYRRTQAQLKMQGIIISTSTLKSYFRTYGGVKENLPEKYIQGFEEKIADREDKLLDDTYTAYEAALKRLIELIPKERSIRALIKVFEILHKIIESKVNGNQPRSLTLIDQINQHLTVQNNNIQSDTKE